MPKFFDISFDGSDIKVVNLLQIKTRLLQETLVAKMTSLMTRVQYRLREKYASGKYATGHLADSVQNPRATVINDRVVGELTIGDSQKALWLEEGLPPKTIYPTGVFSTVRGQTFRTKEEARTKGSKAHVLAFLSNRLGKNVFANYVQIDAVTGKHYIRNTMDEMRDEFVEATKQALGEILK